MGMRSIQSARLTPLALATIMLVAPSVLASEVNGPRTELHDRWQPGWLTVSIDGARKASLTTVDLGDTSAGTNRPFRYLQPPSPVELQPIHIRLRTDVLDLVRLPGRLSRKQWSRVGLALLAVGAATALDDEVARWVNDGSSSSLNLARTIRPLGKEEGLALVGLTWLAGKASGNRRATAIGRDAFEAILVSGLVTHASKIAFGRSRPDGESASFPSGDTAQVFAMASTVAAHFDQRWVDGLAYGLAGLVGWQRMRLNRHHFSDVVAGGLLGWATGRWVVRRNRPFRTDEGPRWDLSPAVGGGEYGVAVRLSF